MFFIYPNLLTISPVMEYLQSFKLNPIIREWHFGMIKSIPSHSQSLLVIESREKGCLQSYKTSIYTLIHPYLFFFFFFFFLKRGGALVAKSSPISTWVVKLIEYRVRRFPIRNCCYIFNWIINKIWFQYIFFNFLCQ